MASNKHCDHAGDADRLFAKPILEYGRFAAFSQQTRDAIMSMSTEERRARADELIDEAAADRSTAEAVQILLHVFSEVEASELIERVRRKARRGCGRKR